MPRAGRALSLALRVGGSRAYPMPSVSALAPALPAQRIRRGGCPVVVGQRRAGGLGGGLGRGR
eukprot:2880069-Rhodomonas_salina.3